MKRWNYRFPGAVYAYGPTNSRYRTERGAREEIRQVWNLKRLPRGTEVWPASECCLKVLKEICPP